MLTFRAIKATCDSWRALEDEEDEEEGESEEMARKRRRRGRKKTLMLAQIVTVLELFLIISKSDNQ